MSEIRIKEMPEQDRPREKLARRGAPSLSDAELLAILLRTGVHGQNAVETGRKLLHDAGSLTHLADYQLPQFTAIKGLGKTKALHLMAAFELGNRLRGEMLTQVRLDSPELVHKFLGGEMRTLPTESLRVVLLNTKYKLIRVQEVSKGTVNESLAHPREILRQALIYSAFAFILVHNHPSGDPSPSRADRRITDTIREASQLMQIEMLDHIIFGAASQEHPPYFSFREHGLL